MTLLLPQLLPPALTNLCSTKLSHQLGAGAQGIQTGERGTGSRSSGEYLGRDIHRQPHGHHPLSIPSRMTCWISSMEASPVHHGSEAGAGRGVGQDRAGWLPAPGGTAAAVNHQHHGTGQVGSALFPVVTWERQLPAKTGRTAIVTMMGNLTVCEGTVRYQESMAVSNGAAWE